MNKKAFTLTEMLLVLLIVSALMTLVIPNLLDTKKTADATSCEAYKELVASQVELYILQEKKTPSSIDDLVGKYIKSNTCPSGEKLKITINDTEIIVEEDEAS